MCTRLRLSFIRLTVVHRFLLQQSPAGKGELMGSGEWRGPGPDDENYDATIQKLGL